MRQQHVYLSLSIKCCFYVSKHYDDDDDDDDDDNDDDNRTHLWYVALRIDMKTNDERRRNLRDQLKLPNWHMTNVC